MSGARIVISFDLPNVSIENYPLIDGRQMTVQEAIQFDIIQVDGLDFLFESGDNFQLVQIIELSDSAADAVALEATHLSKIIQ